MEHNSRIIKVIRMVCLIVKLLYESKLKCIQGNASVVYWNDEIWRKLSFPLKYRSSLTNWEGSIRHGCDHGCHSMDKLMNCQQAVCCHISND